MGSGLVFSLVDLFDLAPVELLLEHDFGGLDLGHQAEHTVAHPEEDEGEHDADEGVRVEPLGNVLVRTVDAHGTLVRVPLIGGSELDDQQHRCECFLKHFYQKL